MQRELSHLNFVRDIFEDLIERLIGMSYEENIFVLQPCRDNALYLLKLLDEMLINERGHKFLVLFFFMLWWLDLVCFSYAARLLRLIMNDSLS